MKWFSTQKPKVERLEEEIRKERGVLAVKIVNFERENNALDKMVQRHLVLLHGAPGETHS